MNEELKVGRRGKGMFKKGKKDKRCPLTSKEYLEKKNGDSRS